MQRLIFFLVGVLLAFVAFFATAATPVQGYTVTGTIDEQAFTCRGVTALAYDGSNQTFSFDCGSRGVITCEVIGSEGMTFDGATISARVGCATPVPVGN